MKTWEKLLRTMGGAVDAEVVCANIQHEGARNLTRLALTEPAAALSLMHDASEAALGRIVGAAIQKGMELTAQRKKVRR